MTFETYFKEKKEQINSLNDQISEIMNEIKQEAKKVYAAEGPDGFELTAPVPSEMGWMGVASLYLGVNGEDGYYLFIPEMGASEHDGWVPSSYMN